MLQPIGFMVVFSLFFGKLAGVSSDGLPYALFSLAALVPWTFFSTVVIVGSDSLVVERRLVSKIYFPRIFIPAGVVAAGLRRPRHLARHLFVIVLVYGIVPPDRGAGAAAADRDPDGDGARGQRGAGGGQRALPRRPLRRPVRGPDLAVRDADRLLEQPIDEPWRTIAAINPMVGVVEGFRWAVLGAASTRPRF